MRSFCQLRRADVVFLRLTVMGGYSVTSILAQKLSAQITSSATIGTRSLA